MNHLNTPPGQLTGAYLKNLILSRGDLLGARAIAEAGGSIYRTELSAAYEQKAAVSAGTTSNDSALVGRPVAFAFQDAMRPHSAVEQLAPRVRKVPSGTRIMTFAGGTTAAEVSEGAPSPVSIGNITAAYLKDRKFQATTVVSAELVRLAAPGSDAAIAADLAAATAAVEDTAFVASMVAAAGANSLASSGSTAAAIDGDVRAMIGFLIAAKSSLVGAVVVLSTTAATYLATLRTSANDTLAYPGVSIGGGTLAGLPAVVSASTTNSILLLDTLGLVFTTGEFDLAVTSEASLQMDSAPDSPTTAATVMISLWQQNLAAVRATAWRNWFARSGAVAAITGLGF